MIGAFRAEGDRRDPDMCELPQLSGTLESPMANVPNATLDCAYAGDR